VPQLLVFSTIQPVIFVIMFRYVFGGAIGPVNGVPYVDFLMPGSSCRPSCSVRSRRRSAVHRHEDRLMERFHALPMARSAVLTGRTFADMSRNVFVVILMMIVGFGRLARPHERARPDRGRPARGPVRVRAVVDLRDGGLALGDPEAAQAAAFPVIAPLVFASSAFVPVESSRRGCRAGRPPARVRHRERRPALTIGGPTTTIVLQALAWIVGIFLVFSTHLGRLYRRTA
jgi:ABC-2 type transport system permease protein/oleandomycin transport system permease protein